MFVTSIACSGGSRNFEGVSAWQKGQISEKKSSSLSFLSHFSQRETSLASSTTPKPTQLSLIRGACSFRGGLVETPVWSSTVQYSSTVYRDYGSSHPCTRLYQPERSLIITSWHLNTIGKNAFRVAQKSCCINFYVVEFYTDWLTDWLTNFVFRQVYNSRSTWLLPLIVVMSFYIPSLYNLQC